MVKHKTTGFDYIKLIIWCWVQAVGLIFAAESTLSGKDILDRVKKVTVARDRQANATMTITDRNGRVQTRTIHFITKGDKKLLATFQEPSDLRGVTFMTTSPENMWIYLPTQARVRRIAGSMVNQGFGGSDFSYKEMNNISSVVDDNEIVKVEQTELNDNSSFLLTLKESDGMVNRLWVEKTKFLPLQIEKLNPAGKIVKRIQFSDFAQADSIWTPKRIHLQDFLKGSSTEIQVAEFRLNIGIKDNLFTEANMKRGGL